MMRSKKLYALTCWLFGCTHRWFSGTS